MRVARPSPDRASLKRNRCVDRRPSIQNRPFNSLKSAAGLGPQAEVHGIELAALHQTFERRSVGTAPAEFGFCLTVQLCPSALQFLRALVTTGLGTIQPVADNNSTIRRAQNWCVERVKN
jgi:hypothetical protein